MQKRVLHTRLHVCLWSWDCAQINLYSGARTCSFEVCVGEREALCAQAEDQMVYWERGIMRRAGSVAAGWGGSLNGTEVWEADTDHSSHTFHTGETCIGPAAGHNDCLCVTLTERERGVLLWHQSLYSSEWWEGLWWNEGQSFSKLSVSSVRMSHCWEMWVKRLKKTASFPPKNIWHMVLIDIVDDLSIEKIFIYWSKIWEIQLQHYAKYEIEETVSSSTSSTFILVLFTMIFN